MFLPPLMLQTVAEYCRSTGTLLPELQDVITAGEQLKVTAAVRWLFERTKGCRLHNQYGPTETHVVTAATLCDGPTQWPELPSIGEPIENARIYILDHRAQIAPIAVVGEIYIGGAAVARGYLNRPELTAERFLKDPFGADPEGRMYRTGDLGRWRADGSIEYLGRNDHQVKIRGFRIELGEIESHLTRHAHVKEAVVLAREDSPGEKRLVAYVTARDPSISSVLGAESLRAHLKAALPDHMVPSAFVVLEAFPLSPNGKLDRRALPSPQSGAYVSRAYEPPQGQVEEILAGIWSEILKIQKIGRHDNFFELGGHSLLGMKMIVEVARMLRIQPPVLTIFQHPTIRKMGLRLEELLALDTRAAPPSSIDMDEGSL
jgi:acyl-coenzyme A synthetase/AMP-(fatty) acid ligase